MYFKPMLASDCTKPENLRFPILASQKLDGVRATVQGGKLMSRSLKEIPNKNVQEMFAGLPEGLDGELILGDPCAPDAYRKTVSVVMSDDKPADGVRLHLFDLFGQNGFIERLSAVDLFVKEDAEGRPVTFVMHHTVHSLAELDRLETEWLALGHEGVMIRSLTGPYKQGRSTEKEGYLLKLKRMADSEAVVLSAYEQMHNANEAKTNELGRTERSTHKENMVPKGVLGGLDVRDLKTGVEFSIGGGFDDAQRARYWKQKDSLVGKIAKYKYFASGSKDKPRFPVFIGWRDERDM